MSRQRVTWTEEQYREYCLKNGMQPSDITNILDLPQKPAKASSRRKKTQAEQEYETILRLAHPTATVLYEVYTLKLAPDCRYTPDLAVIYNDPDFERVSWDFFEVKGRYVFAKALNKPKIAAAMFPHHRFFLASKTVNGWNVKHLMPE